MEIQAVYRRFEKRIRKHSGFPLIIAREPAPGFVAPCREDQVEMKLMDCQREFLEGLNAVFILPGNSKQLKSRYSRKDCYGSYWQSCVFLFARPQYEWGTDPDAVQHMNRFFIKDVLMHEIGHHVDDRARANTKQREAFANRFAEIHG